MKIGFVGLGKVGYAFTKYLISHNANNNFRIVLFSRNNIKTKEIANELDVEFCDNIMDLVIQSDCVMITTNDENIQDVVKKISDCDLTDKTFIHCSGALSSELFSPLIKKGALGYSLHPLQAFIGDNSDLLGLNKCYLTIEGNDKNRKPESNQDYPIDKILELFKDRYSWIEMQQKALYHAAAVVISNYSVTLIHEGYKYLSQIGFNEDEMIKMMYPLMLGTMNNIRRKGTVDSLSGPIIRGDQETIQNHITNIESFVGADEMEFYKLMGLKTIKMIKDKRIDDITYDELENTFTRERRNKNE
jgi:predicted short-subunit dehydrogenase-like oxidoreductase (DUF2520 family)